MKHEQMVETLEAAAGQLGVRVRYDNLNTGNVTSTGGLCRLKGEWCLIIDKKASPAERVSLLVDALAQFDTDALTLPAKIRDALTMHRKGPARAQTDS